MSQTHNIAVLPGDGIGPDVIAEGVKVLKAVEQRIPDARFELREFSVGAGEYLRSGNPLPEDTFRSIQEFDAILLGAMGLPEVRWPSGVEMAPQLDIRERLDFYAGARPLYLVPEAHTPPNLRAAAGIDVPFLPPGTTGGLLPRPPARSSDPAPA